MPGSSFKELGTNIGTNITLELRLNSVKRLQVRVGNRGIASGRRWQSMMPSKERASSEATTMFMSILCRGRRPNDLLGKGAQIGGAHAADLEIGLSTIGELQLHASKML